MENWTHCECQGGHSLCHKLGPPISYGDLAQIYVSLLNSVQNAADKSETGAEHC